MHLLPFFLQHLEIISNLEFPYLSLKGMLVTPNKQLAQNDHYGWMNSLMSSFVFLRYTGCTKSA